MRGFNNLMEILNKRYLLFILILYILFSGLLLNADLPIIDEEPFYFLLSKSIISGQGYRDIFFPTNPFNIEYPPFYPLLMALVSILFPQTIVGLKMVSILSGIASLVVIYILFSDKHHKDIQDTSPLLSNSGLKPADCNPILRRRWIKQASWSWLLLLLICTNPLFLSYSVRTVAEMNYLFFSLITIFLLERYNRQVNSNKLYFWGGGITLILAFYTKTLGLSLVLAVLLYFFIKKRYREFFLIGGLSIFCFLPWIIRNILVSGIPTDYLSSIISGYETYSVSIPKLLFWNIIHYGCSIKYIFLPGCFLHKLTWELPSLFSLLNREDYFNLPFPGLFFIFLVGIILFGFYLGARERFSLIASYMLCYLLMLSFCPPDFFLSDGKRYLYQILPFLAYCFVNGLFGIGKIRFLHFNIKKIIITFFVLIVIIPNLICDLHLIKGNINYLINYKNLSEGEKIDYYAPWFNVYFTAASWVKERLPLNACIMHHFPYTFYLYSGHKTTWFPLREEVIEENLRRIEDEKIDYIVVATQKEEKLVKKLNGLNDNFIFIPIVSFIRCIGKNRLSGFSIIYKIVAINPMVKQLYREGSYYYIKKNYNQAILKFKEGLQLSSDLVGYYNLGIIYEKKGLIKEAISMYKKALKIEHNFQIVENRLNILCQKEFLKRNRKDLTGYKKLGDCYLKNYEYQEAIGFYTKYLQISKRQEVSDNKRRIEISLVHYNLGKAYLSQGDYDEAIKEFEKSLEIMPEFKHKLRHYIKIVNKLKRSI